jgi:CheY-like chemotaxis protein
MATDRTSSGLGSKAKSRPEGKAVARRLLLVGDSPFIHALRQSLGRTGACKALSALSGAEGLRAARTTVPDAILLDAALPDLISSEVCRRLRADPITEAIPLILLTDASKRQGGGHRRGRRQASIVGTMHAPPEHDQTILTARLTAAPPAPWRSGLTAVRDRGRKGANLSRDGCSLTQPSRGEPLVASALPDSTSGRHCPCRVGPQPSEDPHPRWLTSSTATSGVQPSPPLSPSAGHSIPVSHNRLNFRLPGLREFTLTTRPLQVDFCLRLWGMFQDS